MGCGQSSSNPREVKRNTTRRTLYHNQTDVASDVWSRHCFENDIGSDVSFRIPGRQASTVSATEAAGGEAKDLLYTDATQPQLLLNSRPRDNNQSEQLLPPAAVSPQHEFPTFKELPGALDSENDEDDDLDSRDGLYGPSVARPKTTIADLQRSLMRQSVLTDALTSSISKNDPSVQNLSLVQLSLHGGSIRHAHPHQNSLSDSVASLLIDNARPTAETTGLPNTNPHKGHPREPTTGSMPQLALPSPATKAIMHHNTISPIPRPAANTTAPVLASRPLFHFETSSTPQHQQQAASTINDREMSDSPRSLEEDVTAKPFEYPAL